MRRFGAIALVTLAASGWFAGSLRAQSATRTGTTCKPCDDAAIAAYESHLQARLSEIENVRIASNPNTIAPGPSGIAPVMSGEQETQHRPDSTLRDPRGTAVGSSTVLGLLLVRDMYIQQLEWMANRFDEIRNGGVQDKAKRVSALTTRAQKLDRLRDEANGAAAAYQNHLTGMAAAARGNLTGEYMRQLQQQGEELKAAAAAKQQAFHQAVESAAREYPELLTPVSGTPLWEALADFEPESDDPFRASMERFQVYNPYLKQGAENLRELAAEARTHESMDDLWRYGSPAFAQVHNALRTQGEIVGSELPGQLMDDVEWNYKAYDINASVDRGWAMVVLGVASALVIPISPLLCLGVSAIDVTVQGGELVVSILDAQEARKAAPVTGHRRVITAEDREAAAAGGTVLAVVGGLMDLNAVRSVKVVRKVAQECAETEEAAGAVRVATNAGEDASDARRAATGDVGAGEAATARRAATGEPEGIRAQDEEFWRGKEAKDQQRANQYGVGLSGETLESKLGRLDEAVRDAEAAGVPREAIDEALDRIRSPNSIPNQGGTTLDTAIKDFRLIAVLEEAIDKDFVVVLRSDDLRILDIFTGSRRPRVKVLEPEVVGEIVAKAVVDRGRGVTTWTQAQVDLGKRLLEEGEGLKRLYAFDPEQHERGLYALFTDDDIEALEKVFGPDAPPPVVRTPTPRGGQAGSEAQAGATTGGRAGPGSTQRLEQGEIVPRGAAEATPRPSTGARIERLETIAGGKRWGHLGDATVEEAFGHPDLPDDAWVHFGGSEIADGVAETGVRGLGDRSYWARWGEVKGMTQGELRWKIGESTVSGTSDLRTMVVAPEGAGIRKVTGNYGFEAEGVAEGTVEGGRVIVAPEDAPGRVATGEGAAARTRGPPDSPGEKPATGGAVRGARAADTGEDRETGDEAEGGTGEATERKVSDAGGGGAGDTAVAMTSVPSNVSPTVDGIDFRIAPRALYQLLDEPVTSLNGPLTQVSIDPATQLVILDGQDVRGEGTRTREAGSTREVPGGALVMVGPDGGLRVLLTSGGGLGAGAMTLQAVVQGEGPVSLSTEGIVAEPAKLEAKARERIVQEFHRLAGKNPITAKIDTYCLAIGLAPPAPGTLFRVAGQELQQKFAPLRRVLSVSRRLKEAGLLNPDSDPGEYFQSIRQWAIWSLQEKFDEGGFERAFLEKTRQNFEMAGQPWNSQAEELVRSLVPNRWKDVSRILDEVRKP